MRVTSFLLPLIVLLLPLFHVFAHQIKSDAGVTVMLHVEPDDAPIGGTTTPMNFTFTKVPDGFSIDTCDCALSIVSYKHLSDIESLGTVFPITPSNIVYGTTYRVEHNFPKRDVYALVLEGKPRNDNTFEPFSITYDLRVETMIKKVSQNVPVAVNSAVPAQYLFETIAFILLCILVGIGVKLRNFKFKSK
jgi:hypothetical protein